MQTRSAELTAFLNSLHSAITERAATESDERQCIEKIMRALQIEQPSASPQPGWLPVCDLLDEAVNNVTVNAAEENDGQASPCGSNLVDHAQALLALSPQLAWWHRTADVVPGSAMATGHANAMVIGKRGLEESNDVSVGISLIAPDIQYPEHHHPPEEVYLVLSKGHWQKSGGTWFEPGIGGLVHNPPNIMHAMRSGSTPLLATWCLWND